MATTKPTSAALALVVIALGLMLGPASLAIRAQHLLITAQSGTFVDSGQALSASLGVALGDLDGDGDLDAVLASESGIAVWPNTGGGTFAAGPTFGSAYTIGAALGDLDGDSDLDIFAVEDAVASARIWINQGGSQGGAQGDFVAGGPAFGGDLPGGVALGDVDGDGDLDAFLVRNIGRPNQVWLNNGSGGFVDSGQILGAGSSSAAALGDLDGDGDLDAFVADAAVNTVWINQGGAQSGTPGAFSDSGQSLGDALAVGVSLGDTDRDGDLDAVTASVNSGVRLWINQGGAQAGAAGAFAAGSMLGTSGNRHASLVDVDGDGDRDLFVARSNANTVWVNQGGLQAGVAGVFVDSGQRLGNLFSYAAALGDLDGDNDADALVTNSGAATKVWRNEGLSGLQTAYQIRDGVLAGSARGRRYIDLYNTHSREILDIILADRALFETGYDTLIGWLPGLQTLVDGSGGGAVITQVQVDALDSFLGDLEARGSVALRQTITDERAALPALDSFVGQTMAEARANIIGTGERAVYLPLIRTPGGSLLSRPQPHQDGATQAMGGCFMACWLGTYECQ
ncbi:FG-GAP-like repeat-containing protein [Candidatus Chloroploca sp. Khr17]|uniref:FG-GAP-like repeat-containing protein n=1 Tax=Candidatus Chloroploca sp. Khr17 TaxID=2496869 RepID=UPI0013EBABF8|nr:FG-GAP-like repeat-containing protein [Candidatus Chloroploca sp. Khr17]